MGLRKHDLSKVHNQIVFISAVQRELSTTWQLHSDGFFLKCYQEGNPRQRLCPEERKGAE
jgi:hypothetical protein